MKCGPNTHRHLIVVVLLSSVLWAQTGGRQADDSRSDVKRELPIPSGEYGVGRQALDLTDNTHPD
ncbi:MAG TPA: hypothetical protein VK638_12725, partial [Edaphobacter sp.]|nr:hypothetical protein [Edaphobacter sp.]